MILEGLVMMSTPTSEPVPDASVDDVLAAYGTKEPPAGPTPAPKERSLETVLAELAK